MMGRGRVAAWTCALFALMLVSGWGNAGASAALIDWEVVDLEGPVLRLFAPVGGAIFARTDDGFFRGDDGGATWEPVDLPPSPGAVAVSPIDQGVLYAGGPEGLYRSEDAGATWRLVLATADLPTTERVLHVAVSPADPELVYVALTGRSSPSADFRLLRSRDGGMSWQQLEEAHNSLCGWGVRILEPHPADPERVFRTAGCYAGRDLVDDLEHSADQGESWSAVIRPEGAFPERLVGGRGAAPTRFYLAANRDARVGGSSIFRSDDDGQSWREVLAFRGGGTAQESTVPDIRVGGLAYNPAAPDRVFVGLNAYLSRTPNRPLSGSEVRASTNGGATWAILGGRELGEIRDLALSGDGLSLFAATDRGLWRIRLDQVPPGRPPAQIPVR